jgi:hypothetical protein
MAQPPSQVPYGQPGYGYGAPGPGGPGGYGAPAPAAPPRSAAPRKGSSKALPILVSAGLAVGVFTGLMVAVGDGKKGEPVGGGTTAAAAIDAGGGATATVTAPIDAATATPDAGTTVATSATPDAGAAKPTPAIKKATLSFEPTPADAQIFVDGKQIDGTSYEVELSGDKVEVEVVAKADGFKQFSKKISLRGDTTLPIKMSKKGNIGRPHTPRPNGPGGLIDL